MVGNIRRTVKCIYDGSDLNEDILAMQLTPYSEEEFLFYKDKLDKAINDLVDLIDKQIDNSGKLGFKESLNSMKLLNSSLSQESQASNSSTNIYNRYYKVHTGLMKLDILKNEIIRCFVKWKNDYYYTQWDELKNPPQELLSLWLEFKNIISELVDSCDKISKQPQPRLSIAPSQGKCIDSLDDSDNNIEKMKQIDLGSSGTITQITSSKKEEYENKSENSKLNELNNKEDVSKLGEANKNNRRVKVVLNGSTSLWGPKEVPKNQKHYISGMAKMKSVKKRLYSSNGRLKILQNRNISDKIRGVDNCNVNEITSLDTNNTEIVRNLRNWERIEEKKIENKRKVFLYDDIASKNLIKHEKDFKKDVNWITFSSNFSKGCRELANVNRDEEIKIVINEQLMNQILSNIESTNSKVQQPSHEYNNMKDFCLLDNSDIDKLELIKSQFSDSLKQHFGYEEFREGQLETIMSILCPNILNISQNRNKALNCRSILILPTGYGKSLCYQYLSLHLSYWYSEITLVITPLISLMHDQLKNLPNCLRGAIWNSNVHIDDKKMITKLIKLRKLDILFITPESLHSKLLVDSLIIGDCNNDKSNNSIGMVCIDEAHCISEWGHSFRPSYISSMKIVINELKIKKILAITATAPKNILSELKNLLNISEVIQPHKNNSIQRKNLLCKFIYLDLLKARKPLVIDNNKVPKQYNKYSILWDYLKYTINQPFENNKLAKIYSKEQKKNSKSEVWSKYKNILIYVWQKNNLETITNYMKNKGLNVLYYHGSLSNNEREIVQNSFMENKVNIFVATTSFGMGIDKKDIDAVVHWDMPNSLEQYIQETGRCARDNNRTGTCLLFLCDDDYKSKRQIISSNLIDKVSLRSLVHIILGDEYFNETYNDDIIELNNNNPVNKGFQYKVYPLQLFRNIANIRNNEDIEMIMYYIKMKMDNWLQKTKNIYKDLNIVNLNYYIRGSINLKLRCFNESFQELKKKNDFLNKISCDCTEISGVITLNILEVSQNTGLSIEYIENEIESLRTTLQISMEKPTDKPCVVLCISYNEINGTTSDNMDDGGTKQNIKVDDQDRASTELEQRTEIHRNEMRDLELDNKYIKPGYLLKIDQLSIDYIVEQIFSEIKEKKLNEIRKLDIAYLTFQKSCENNSLLDDILDLYFNDDKIGFYKVLFGENKKKVDKYNNKTFNSINTLDNSFITQNITRNTDFTNDEWQSLLNDMWLYKWNEEMKDIVLKDGTDFVNKIFKDAKEKTYASIKSTVNFTLDTYLKDFIPIQWETYRQTVNLIEDVIEQSTKNSVNKDCEAIKKGKLLNKVPFTKLYNSGSIIDQVNFVFPSDLARIFVGVSTYKFGYTNNSNYQGNSMAIRRKRVINRLSDITNTKIWGIYKHIPYNEVLEICTDTFRERTVNKLISN
ncbi:ATP-dependent DNA helicase, RecQ family protein [Cryptosporidium muris RN66]|uniref:DNA 3'-5' helicase n=1 Tax=Cryptosporidium muris (strain RN66) TaxID=441375 RepID=B6AJ04_CRYMR|nr:ATP-dependent DNA helicase, RecQ family protein [Cryptosporidium muris RN66]EEA08195.1 ATP-dependent DNA helicase, RecQ family protein [Cryptosporidium muris RN66]|eukprot:XP_002142544.1 ATP-dependent DNA helicase, RecQ family protein [Cryptosporidium muris RN66]